MLGKEALHSGKKEPQIGLSDFGKSHSGAALSLYDVASQVSPEKALTGFRRGGQGVDGETADNFLPRCRSECAFTSATLETYFVPSLCAAWFGLGRYFL